MKLEHELHKTGQSLADAGKKAVATIKDTASETAHRTIAETERHKRETLGDALTPSEKAKSVLNEAKNTVQANVDAAKKKYGDA
jgi:hypothetical protein